MPQLDINLALNSLPEIAKEAGVDPNVARAIFLSENSGYGPDGKLNTRSRVDTSTTSPVGATGLMQVMPATVQGLVQNGLLSSTADLNDPTTQLRAGVAAIKDGMVNGMKPRTPVEQAVYYNGGPQQLANLRAGRALAPETADYVKKFGAHMGMQAIDAAVAPATPASPTMNINIQREGSVTHSRDIPAGLSADIFDAASEYNGLSAEMTAQLRALSAQVLPAATAQKAAEDSATAARTAQIQAVRDSQLATENSKQTIASAFNLDLNNPDNIIAKNKLIATSAHNERALMQNQITALSSKSPMSDPVGWLMDSIKAAPIIARHNALLQQEDTANANILQNQQEATAQAAIQPANLQSAINAKAIADADAAIADGQQKKLAIDGAARGELARNSLGILQVGGQNVANKIRIGELFSSSTSTSFTDTNREGMAGGKDDGLGLVNAVGAAMGLPAFTKQTLAVMPKETRDALIENAQLGRLGKTPGNAVSLLYTIGGNNLGKTLADAPMANKFLQGVVAAGQKELDAVNSPGAVLNPLDKLAMGRSTTPIKQLAFGIDRWVARKEDELKIGNMADLPKDNPYRFDPITAAADPAMQDNPVAKIIVASSRTGQQVNDQWLLSSMAGQIATKQMTSAQASTALADFYARGYQRQFTNQAMGVVGFKPQTEYPSVNKLFGVTFSKVDMMNPVSLENYFVKEISSQLSTGTPGIIPTPNAAAAQMRGLR